MICTKQVSTSKALSCVVMAKDLWVLTLKKTYLVQLCRAVLSTPTINHGQIGPIARDS